MRRGGTRPRGWQQWERLAARANGVVGAVCGAVGVRQPHSSVGRLWDQGSEEPQPLLSSALSLPWGRRGMWGWDLEGMCCVGSPVPHRGAQQRCLPWGQAPAPRDRRPRLWVKGGGGEVGGKEECLPDFFFPMGSLKKRRKSVSRGMGTAGLLATGIKHAGKHSGAGLGGAADLPYTS